MIEVTLWPYLDRVKETIWLPVGRIKSIGHALAGGADVMLDYSVIHTQESPDVLVLRINQLLYPQGRMMP